jgi:hypothetical protein
MARLQFEIPEEQMQELDILLKRTGLKTRVQLFNSAISLFEWAVRQREGGRIIASMDEQKGTYKELEMPGLPAPRIAESAQEKVVEQLPQPAISGANQARPRKKTDSQTSPSSSD